MINYKLILTLLIPLYYISIKTYANNLQLIIGFIFALVLWFGSMYFEYWSIKRQLKKFKSLSPAGNLVFQIFKEKDKFHFWGVVIEITLCLLPVLYLIYYKYSPDFGLIGVLIFTLFAARVLIIKNLIKKSMEFRGTMTAFIESIEKNLFQSFLSIKKKD